MTLPPEVGETFAQNALGKARAAALATGAVSFADDSGISAAALGGAPGVRSARYAGEHASDEENLAKLLREAPAGSGSSTCARSPTWTRREASSSCSRVAAAGAWPPSRAGQRGFGYDPAFLPDDGPPRADDGASCPTSKRTPSAIAGAPLRALLRWLRSQQVDRGRDGDGEPEAGVAGVAREQQQQRGQQRDEHRRGPGDAGD